VRITTRKNGQSTLAASASRAKAANISKQIETIIGDEHPLSKLSEFRELVKGLIKETMSRFEVAEKYNWLIIHDPVSMTRADADRIYTATNKFKKSARLDLL
jgi:hypothetical protein